MHSQYERICIKFDYILCFCLKIMHYLCRQMKDTVLYIKNMVCDRCKMAVEHELRNLGLTPIKVELGVVCVKEEVDSECRAKIRAGLEALGFELLEDRQQQTVDRIKSLIIELVHYRNNKSGTNLSAYLSEQLGSDYSALSKLFSENTGMTIENFHLAKDRTHKGTAVLRRNVAERDSRHDELFERGLSQHTVQEYYRNDSIAV